MSEMSGIERPIPTPAHEGPGWGAYGPRSVPVPAYRGSSMGGTGDDKPKWYKRAWARYAAVAFVGLLLGATLFKPAPTVQTREVAAPVVASPSPSPVAVPTTPQSCLEALDYADRGFALAGDAFVIVSDAFQAIGNGDAAELDRQTTKLGNVAGPFNALAPKYNAAKAKCRDSR